MESSSLVERLDWDSAHFGVEVGQLRADAERENGGWQDAVAEGRRRGLAVLYARVAAEDLETLAAATAAGWRPVDVRVELDHDLLAASEADDRHRVLQDAELRAAPAELWSDLAQLAGGAIGDTRFFRDPLLAPRARAMYERWAELYAERSTGLCVLAEAQSHPIGFVAAAPGGDGAWAIELVAVDAASQGQGIGAGLVRSAVHALAARDDVRRVDVATQLTNTKAIRAYERSGFRMGASAVWVHAHPAAGANPVA